MPYTSLDHATVPHDSLESVEEMPQPLDSDVVEPNLNSVHGVDRPFACHVPPPALFRRPRPTPASDDTPSVASSARDVAHHLSNETSFGLAATLEEISLKQSGNQFSSVLASCKIVCQQFADCSHRFSELCDIFTGADLNAAVIQLNGCGQREISNVEHEDESCFMPVFDLRQQCHRFEQMRHAVFNVFSVFNGNFTCRDIQRCFSTKSAEKAFEVPTSIHLQPC